MNTVNDLENIIGRALQTAEARKSFPKLNTFRDCFEGGMDFDTALGCAGMADVPEVTKTVLKRQWAKWEAMYS